MAKIEKKIWPEYFDLIESGKKKYELRLADFSIAEGDELVLKEWDPQTKQYTGREITKKTNYVRKFAKEDLEKMYGAGAIEEHGFYIIQLD